jgi:DNA-repair protein XRCC3
MTDPHERTTNENESNQGLDSYKPNALHPRETSANILKTGCERIDEILRGGIRTKQITEFVGENGTGKTQLMLQLMLTAQISLEKGGLNGSCVYVSTEEAFAVSRLEEILRTNAFVRERLANKAEALDRVYVFKAMGTAENCWEVLRSISHILRVPRDEEHPVKVIVIDSLTAPFRDDLEEIDMRGGNERQRNMHRVILRAQFLYRFTHLLKEFAWKHDLAVVVTNHVVDSFEDESVYFTSKLTNNNKSVDGKGKGKQNEEEEEEENENDYYGKRAFVKRFKSSGRFVKPGLGLAWANCPNTSVFLSVEEQFNGVKTRYADAFRSPFAAPGICKFRIATAGIINDDLDVDEE